MQNLLRMGPYIIAHRKVKCWPQACVNSVRSIPVPQWIWLSCSAQQQASVRRPHTSLQTVCAIAAPPLFSGGYFPAVQVLGSSAPSCVLFIEQTIYCCEIQGLISLCYLCNVAELTRAGSEGSERPPVHASSTFTFRWVIYAHLPIYFQCLLCHWHRGVYCASCITGQAEILQHVLDGKPACVTLRCWGIRHDPLHYTQEFRVQQAVGVILVLLNWVGCSIKVTGQLV